MEWSSNEIMKIIVMTGVSSGIGRVATEQLTERGHRVIAGACDLVSTEAVEVRPLDLANLETVRAFAATLGTMHLDTLALNAGLQGYDLRARTTQGFERTFGVNHLAHYLLARLLLPQIKDGGTLIFTASSTHDPAEKTVVPPPNHANAEWLAYPERDPHVDQRPIRAGLRAYSSSKLCNVMTARTIATHRDALARGLRVFAYDPGLTPGTGLVRSAPFVVRRLVWPLLTLIQPFSHGMSSLVDAGRGLADLSDGTISSQTAIYCSLRKGKLIWPPPSTLAQDDAACARLWRDSAAMVGLPL
jgi:NAD(P)-dependent dehydrogenase (short-subunit alcohol dehydrogenase family)